MTTANDNGFNDRAYFCEKCGSANVSFSSLKGGEATCLTCRWKGRFEELTAVPFSHDFSSPEAMLHALFLDVRQLMAKSLAVDLAKVLLKWGFMEKIEPKLLARYIGVTANAMVQAIIRERQAIEKEAAS